MYLVGFDPAIHNLGIVIIEYDTEWEEKIRKIIQNINDILYSADVFKKMDELNKEISNGLHLFENMYKLVYLNNVNLVGDKKITECDDKFITLCLKKFINDFKKQIDFKKDNVVVGIEYQMNINNTTQLIMHQLLYEFIENNVKIIAPFVTTKCKFGGNCFQHFVKKYSNRYNAKKQHSAECFRSFCELRKIDCSKFKRLHDISDAFLIAYSCIETNE